MPSTYSTSLKLELIGNGEQAGAWGTTTNNNLGTLLEQAITGVLPLTIYGDTTLTNYNGLSDQARNAVLFLTGNLTSSCNVIAPSGQQKVYIVRNYSGATVNIKTTSGNAVSLTNAASAVVFTDGTDFYSATTLNYIDGDLTVTGTLAVNTSIIAPEINERTTISGTGIGSSLNFDTLTQTVYYSTASATANCGLNIRGSSTVALNSLLATGQSTCVAVFVTNGSTPYYISSVSIDGVSVTPKWQGSTAPTTGNPSSVDVYTYNIIKTANATYSVFASQTQFA
jgi:hypothetical protein